MATPSGSKKVGGPGRGERDAQTRHGQLGMAGRRLPQASPSPWPPPFKLSFHTKLFHRFVGLARRGRAVTPTTDYTTTTRKTDAMAWPMVCVVAGSTAIYKYIILPATLRAHTRGGRARSCPNN